MFLARRRNVEYDFKFADSYISKSNKFHLVVEPLRSYYDACIRVVEYSIAVVF